ncbi:hypothetical protein Ancab_031756 [Ancistrocladus abbreviatus]
MAFLKTIKAPGMYAVLTIGPYVCAEWNYGGFPVWLHGIPNIQLRTDNEIFKKEMEIFVTKIVNMAKHEELFAPQGGPIIHAQIENEYGNIMGSYGDAGKGYIEWCAKMAESKHIGVPWFMTQQSNPPAPMINTSNGFYCDQFWPSSKTMPKMWTENWSSWGVIFTFTDWGGREPRRTAEICHLLLVVSSNTVARSSITYHGGTNFGRTSSGPYIATNYDYNAPIDEYGSLNGEEKKVKMPRGIHTITLISATVGLQNYGGNFDTVLEGVLGPVQLIGKQNNNEVIKDLSNSTWLYKVA